MRRATITIPDDLDRAIEAFQQDQPVPPSLTVLTQAALREYRAQRGYVLPRRTLRIQPLPVGSGKSDVSINYDQYAGNQCNQANESDSCWQMLAHCTPRSTRRITTKTDHSETCRRSKTAAG
jgi:hypothetical protein